MTKSTTFVFLVFASVVVSAFDYKINADWCQYCLKSGADTCVDAKFSIGMCCESTTCKTNYKYCSTNLTSDIYKSLSCPQYDCRNDDNTFFANKT